ncbi:ABC transporter ATP-binding protein [Corynebacterium aquilae]|uniref:ABC transporter ATP-binding protein n=1 Tax=Corynebacterium aquilae DSM 44791 TaxID=1431546 RepID=A0A1L7CI60_9CORY|nr:ABC transporter ATP-binding protein [Corynebacterium aquilae]APT85541.1 ABC transporter ATP-binding protein [Corynebacterium aquilae DSM 44791]
MIPFLAPLHPDPRVPAIALRGLTKVFGEHTAVNNLDLDIPRGSFYGIVGPNGAGKTTAITMATGLLRPSDGQAWIAGHEVWSKHSANVSAKSAYGLLADNLPVFDRLSATEFLSYVGLLRGMDEGTIAQRTQGLLETLDLPSDSKLIVDYSAGMTKKILLAAALLHRPEVLILDEPFEAVDPVSARHIRQILSSYRDAGGTVVMSSHVMELVQGLCDHVAIVAQGRVLTAGTSDEVRQGSSLDDVFVDLVGGGDVDTGSLGWLGGASS